MYHVRAMNRLQSALLGLLVFASAGCTSSAPRERHDDNPPEVAATGNFCWSRFPLLQQEKVCATPEESSLAMNACTRTALEALSHSHAANRDWFGLCMKRYGLSRLDN